MKQNDQLKRMALWLATKRHQPWVRGKNDCCTLFMEYHDYMTGESTLDELWGKYHDLRTAIRFAKQFPKVKEWFPAHGYQQQRIALDGDIVMVKNNRFFPSSYIVCGGFAWGIMDNAKRMSRHELVVPDVEYSIWRRNYGT